jgi:hypothetical protein
MTEMEYQWENRKEIDLAPDEISLLRGIIREAKGIDQTIEISAKVCTQCYMVGDSCSCGRSWF